jgi:uncharacterized protein
MGLCRAARALRLPARALAEPRRSSIRSGPRRRRRGCRSCSTSAAACAWPTAACSTREYFENGGPPVPDFHGGDENFRSVDYMAIPTAPMQTLATLIFDGVLERFPRLKFGVIEQGASWVPSWMRFMDSAFDAFRKREERLQKLSLRPSENTCAARSARRRIRRRTWAGSCARRPRGVPVLVRTTRTSRGAATRSSASRRACVGLSEAEKQRFYHDNFVDLMGAGLPSA